MDCVHSILPRPRFCENILGCCCCCCCCICTYCGDMQTASNQYNGMDLEDYSWGQTPEKVSVEIPVPNGTKSRSVVCEITSKHLKVGLKGHLPVINGELHQPVRVKNSFWRLEEQEEEWWKTVAVHLSKANRGWWKYLLKGEPELSLVRKEYKQHGIMDPDDAVKDRSVDYKEIFSDDEDDSLEVFKRTGGHGLNPMYDYPSDSD